MSVGRPDCVILLSETTEGMAARLRTALPALDVRIGGPAPNVPYAVIGFQPGESMLAYRDAQWVHISGAGADGMLQALARAGAQPELITRTVGQMGRQIGEYVLSYVLADYQRHADRGALQTAGIWDAALAAPQAIADARALIIGTGGIGAGVARTLSAVGMRCMGVSRSGQPCESFDRVIRWHNLSASLEGVDVIIGALPLTPETESLLNAEFFTRFDGALFINVGRGATANISDMVSALDTGLLRQAVLDVLPEEPLCPDDPLWAHPQVTITPHVSGLTQPSDAVAAFIAAYHALEQGEVPELIVDPAAGY